MAWSTTEGRRHPRCRMSMRREAWGPRTIVVLAAFVLGGSICLVGGGVATSSVASPAQLSSPADSDESPESDNTLTVGVTGEVDTLNPMTYILAVSYTLQTYLWDGLTAPSPTSITDIAPSLAESWDVAPNGLTITYHLRPGLKWSDGRALTAADAEYTFERVLAGGPPKGTWGSYLENVTSVSAPDDLTVQLKLSSPNVMLPRLSIPILPKHVFEKYSDEDLDEYPVDPENLVTSGPYRLLEGGSGSSLYRFEAWSGNWRGESPVRYVNWRLFQAQDTVMQALIKGEIDYTLSIDALQMRGLADQPNIVTNEYPELGVFVNVGFNTGSVDTTTGDPLGDPNPAVLDPDFRRALSTAFDREQIRTKAFKGSLIPLTTVVAAGFEEFQWDPAAAGEPTDYDPELAADRLDEAGYVRGTDGKRMLPNGEPIGTLRLVVDPAVPADLAGARLVGEWMDDLGIDTRVTTMSNSKLNDTILSGNYDMFWWGWAYDADPDQILTYLTCAERGVFSDTWYCSEEYDDLYAQQKTDLDPASRIATIKAMQELLYQEAPYIVLGGNMGQQAYRTDRWQGWTSWLQDDGNVMWDVGALFDLRPADGTTGNGVASPRRVAAFVYGSLAGTVALALLLRLSVVRWRRSTAEDRE